MIQIVDKQNCCGCGACAQICARHCILMQEDKEGFLYPTVDAFACTNCGACEKVCPVINKYQEPILKPKSYACKSKDEKLIDKSSSGGFFTVIAEYVIDNGGVVFGARFNSDWSVVHDYAETKAGLAAFRGSKYVQSVIGDNYKKVKLFLKKRRMVLFTGTPCQVSGLNHYLQRQYENLITVDFVCHSIPSPKVWRLYLKEIKKDSIITSVTFRDKSEGWNNYGLLIHGINSDKESKASTLVQGNHHENVYMKAFLRNLTVRPSCLSCPARKYTAGSDIMIADCWGVNTYHPEINNNKGMSLVLLQTDRGCDVFNTISEKLFILSIPYAEVEEETNHSPIIKFARPHHFRQIFFKNMLNGEIVNLMNKLVSKGEKRKKRIELTKYIIRRIVGDRLITIIGNRL